jgi:XTP/dITP diphosphohydrolase
MKIVLSTRNPSKTEQIRAIFADSSISVIALNETSIEGDVVEDGKTLRENALKKALFVAKHLQPKVWVMADDTGIFIKALSGRPGVKSARWAGETTTEQITQYTLKQLEGVTDRSAIFETVVAVVSPEGQQYFFSGKVHGKILEASRVPPQPKMPYSPIFVPDGTNLTWAEMTLEQENSISHRGKAFRQAREFLESL